MTARPIDAKSVLAGPLSSIASSLWSPSMFSHTQNNFPAWCRLEIPSTSFIHSFCSYPRKKRRKTRQQGEDYFLSATISRSQWARLSCRRTRCARISTATSFRPFSCVQTRPQEARRKDNFLQSTAESCTCIRNTLYHHQKHQSRFVPHILISTTAQRWRRRSTRHSRHHSCVPVGSRQLGCLFRTPQTSTPRRWQPTTRSSPLHHAPSMSNIC